MAGKAVFREEFDEFIADPGLQIRPGGRKTAALGDVYVFPDLEPLDPGGQRNFSAGGGKISSSRLIDYAAAGGGALICGPEDSGKTSLLKVLARVLLDSGFFPLYADGKTLRIPGREETDEFFLACYSSQYAPGSRESMEGGPRGKRVLLLDNADWIMTGSRELGSFLSVLTSHFGAVLLTAANPLEYSELPEGFSVFGVPEGYAVFDIAELGYALRDELISKWITAGGGPEDEKDGERRRERLRGAVDNVIERNLVPSYPVFVLTILQTADSEDTEGRSASSYGQYYEYLITKSLKCITDRANLTFFTGFLSELAYMLFSRRSRWISEGDILALIDAGAPELKSLPGGPGNVVSGLLQSDILAGKESGYEFRYGYIYHYFAALYMSLNLKVEGVKDEVKRLACGLEDEESANIMLFLTHLSGDPFLLEQIARNVEYAASSEEPYAKEEEEHYLDELIYELEKLTDKDRKLKEIRAEYLPPDTHGRQPIGFRTNGSDIMVRRRKEALGTGSRRRTLFIEALLRVSSEAFRAGAAMEGRGAFSGFAESLLILWSSSLRRWRRKADRARESVEGMENHYFGRGDTAEELSYTRTLCGLYMRIYARSARLLSILGGAGITAEGENAPDELMVLCSGLLRKEHAPAPDKIGMFLNNNPERKFARQLLRECASLRGYLYRGEDEYSRDIEKLLDPGKGAGPYFN